MLERVNSVILFFVLCTNMKYLNKLHYLPKNKKKGIKQTCNPTSYVSTNKHDKDQISYLGRYITTYK